jgi:hypothetical protein
MQNSVHLLRTRRFVPIFVTQFLGAFNDNLFRTAMVLLVIYGIYKDAAQEATFSAVAGGLFILPFFLLSALAGQLADSTDKARMVRLVKTAEIVIMMFGAAGLLLHNVPLLLDRADRDGGPFDLLRADQICHFAAASARRRSARRDRAGRGRNLYRHPRRHPARRRARGAEPDGSFHGEWAALGVLVVAAIGRVAGHFVPPAPPDADAPPLTMDWHIVRASIRLVSATLHIPRLFLAILAISFFWAMGAVLAAQFPPLVKNALGADQTVATLFLATFSIGVALGSVAVNRCSRAGVGALFARLGAAHGAVRARPVPPHPRLAGGGPSCATSAISSPCAAAG